MQDICLFRSRVSTGAHQPVPVPSDALCKCCTHAVATRRALPQRWTVAPAPRSQRIHSPCRWCMCPLHSREYFFGSVCAPLAAWRPQALLCHPMTRHEILVYKYWIKTVPYAALKSTCDVLGSKTGTREAGARTPLQSILRLFQSKLALWFTTARLHKASQ